MNKKRVKIKNLESPTSKNRSINYNFHLLGAATDLNKKWSTGSGVMESI